MICTKKHCINFTGLTRVLSENILSHKTIKELPDAFPNSGSKVGSLPNDWVRAIPREERADKISEIYSGLDDVHGCLLAGELKEAGQVLSSALNQAGVHTEKPAEFEKLDRGSMGTAYRFNVNAGKYVFKTFDDTVRHYGNEHGAMIEPNNGMVIKKRYGNCQLPYVYVADLQDGWMISKFRTPDEKPVKVIDLKEKGISHDDAIGDNRTAGGHILDLGGISFRGHSRDLS